MPNHVAADHFHNLRVRDAHAIMAINPTTVRPADSIDRLARLAMRYPATRVLSVIDDEQRLIGILPLRGLSLRVLSLAYPEYALRLTHQLPQIEEYLQATRGNTAGDLMDPPQSVGLDQALGDAFERIISLRLDGLPVTDAQRRVVGYLDVVEAMLACLRPRDEGIASA